MNIDYELKMEDCELSIITAITPVPNYKSTVKIITSQ